MAWRFKASKYKNAAPVVPKPEACVRDICVGSYQTYGNNIAASGRFMAFNWDHVGSSLAVLPLEDCGRKSKMMPLLHAHSDTVTDLDFSPFHDGLLATGSQDCLVKIWHIPEAGLQESLSNAECTFSHKQRRVETVGFHPTANFLLHSTSYTTFTLWDLASQQEIFSNGDHSDVIQSVSWKRDGTLVATSCKDKQVRILDPRVENSCIRTANSHQSIKDSRVVWLGESNRILTTGFDAQRLRQVIIRDVRNFGELEKTLELDCSTGILIPLYDADTGMLFLAGKGDTTINYMEVTDKEPYLIEGIRHSGEQTKGACLVPKRALNVMQGEVNRIMQLSSNTVVPVTYQVPRKTYRDFHSDLFPDTPGYTTELQASEWFQGKNNPLKKINLDPSKRTNGEDPITVHMGPLAKLIEDYANMIIETSKPVPPVSKKTEPIKLHPVRDIIKGLEKEKEKSAPEPIPDNRSEYQSNIEATPVVPKPLPRASRAASVCTDTGANNSHVPVAPEENITPPPVECAAVASINGSSAAATNANKPVARPRTNSCVPVIASVNPTSGPVGGYKPRLGPKPFTPTVLTDTETFDKVFSVPQVPSANSNGSGHPEQQPPTSLSCAPSECDDTVISNDPLRPSGDGDYLVHVDDNKDCKDDTVDDDEDYKPKTPSTAERRKVFETRSGSQEEDCADGEQAFERASAQRNSIAERRRMYERSQSTVEPGTGVVEKPDGSPVMLRRKDSLKNRKNNGEISHKADDRKSTGGALMTKQQSLDPKKNESVVPKRTSTVFGRVSKFRHLKGTPAHKSQHIENVRNLSRQISGECDGFHANPDRVAVPLSGPGGKIAIFELAKTGRLPDGVIPTLVHGNSVMDFQWDPFNYRRLTVALDDGICKIWEVPEGGLLAPTNEALCEFNAHGDKIYFIKYHPTAQNVLATGSYDMTIKLWDLERCAEGIPRIVLHGHTDQMFSFAWSPCGQQCTTVSKDGRIRVYRPRASTEPVREGAGPMGSRGARIVWALDGRFIVCMGFDKVSERQIIAYNANDLTTPLNTVGLDVSPAILIPYYDDDSSTLFLTGKGDSTIYAFEIAEEAPYICPLSHHRCNSLHQGLSFLTKNACDIASVEFAKALRLTNNSIEPLSFTVPRIKTDLFQDDLFPSTRVIWKPTLTADEWFSGKDKAVPRISLKPEGMDSLSDSQGSAAPVERTINKSASQPFMGANQPYNRWNPEASGQCKLKQEEIQKSVSRRMDVDMRLEQDDMEGVDASEWDD